MKQFVKILLAITFLLNITGCNKDNSSSKSYMNEGIITGYDLKTCQCCGGLMINFHNDTALYSDPYYLIDNESSTLGISDSTEFPVKMKVDWVKDTAVCGGTGNHIIITHFLKE